MFLFKERSKVANREEIKYPRKWGYLSVTGRWFDPTVTGVFILNKGYLYFLNSYRVLQNGDE
jgi:hypothetical protein